MNLFADMRFVLRALRRNPAFVATAVLSLALGIGANTAIFTLADQMLLRVLPVKEPNRLVLFKWTGQFIGGSSRGWQDTFSYPMYADLRDGDPGVFAGVAARYQDTVDIAAGGPAQRATADLVSGNFFQVLGVSPAIGRTFTPDDDRVKNAEPVVVLSYGYWQSRFNGDAAVLNRVLDLNGHPMTVIGVAQRGFRGFERLSPADVFVPMTMKTMVTPTWDDMARRNSIWLKIFARLRPGVSEKAAQAAMAIPFQTGLENDLRSVPWGQGFRKVYLRDRLTFADASQGLQQTEELFRKPLYVLLAMVSTLLLIACVNVASLLITRASGRQKEVAIRLSLGATRAALVRLIMTESLLLALASGAIGLVLASWISYALVGMLPIDNIGTAISTAPDLRVLGFTAAVTLITALLFGLAPALQATSPDVAPALKNEGGNLSSGAGQTRLRRILVSSQVALSLLLLAGAGLFARSLYNIRSLHTGIATDQLLQFSIDPSLHKYTPERARSLFLAVQQNLDRLPGVVSATGAAYPLLADGWQNTMHVEGYHPHPGEDMNPGYEEVLPGFFSAVGAPLMAGREFSERDSGKLNVVIVNQEFARRFFPHSSPLGHHIGWGGDGPTPYEIVGVVKDLKAGDIKEQPRPWTFSPLLQDPAPSEITFYVRSSRDPLSVADEAHQAVRRLDPSLPVYNVKTVQTQLAEGMFIERLFALLSAAFGFFATLLACVGLYGVTAQAVARRTREIGIRIALGAERCNVVQLVMREVLVLALVGILIGIPATIALGRLVESQLYGLQPTDPFVVAGAAGIIVIVCVLSACVPARRATRIDPLQALRYE
jgi:predicted permease